MIPTVTNTSISTIHKTSLGFGAQQPRNPGPYLLMHVELPEDLCSIKKVLVFKYPVPTFSFSPMH